MSKVKLFLIVFITSIFFNNILPINYSEVLKNTFFAAVILKCAQPIITNLYNNKRQPRQTKVGLLSIKGSISNSHEYILELKKFFENKDIKAILLVIDSGGGAPASSEAIGHEILELKKKYQKPVITLVKNTCASAAYYIASCTDYIIASPSSLLGSIGVYIPLDLNFKEFLAQHNIHYEAIVAGDYKLLDSSFTTLTDDQKKWLQTLVQSIYDHFVNHVASCRNLNIQEKDIWANGKIFTGIQAKNLNLIDAIGSWSDALTKVKELASIQNDNIVFISAKDPTGWQSIIWKLLNLSAHSITQMVYL